MRPAAIVAFAAAVCAWPAAGQSFRGTATSTGRYIQVRPISPDSVPLSEVERRPDGDYHNGIRVICTAGFNTCARYVAGPVENAYVLTQDVSLTAWGLGLQGLSATFSLRGRADTGSDFVWPRSADAFDAMLAYAELDRGAWRIRAGRQRSASGLGFAGFDGASILFDATSRLQLEAFGGRSLARGLTEPRNEALRSIESFVLDRQAWLMGGTAWFEPYAGASLTARYQREIWSDRSGLLSERASIDFRSPLPGPFSLSASADYDFAFGRIGKASATVRAPLGGERPLWLELMGRRYVPWFELWTIWGFFEPAAWHEAELRASWRPSPSLFLSGYGGWRLYDDTQTEVILSELPDESQRAGLGAVWNTSEKLSLSGDYAIEKGFGAFLSSGNLRARYQVLEPLYVALDATAFQQIEEFRVGDGTVLGGGGAIGWEFSTRTSLDAGFNVYRQTFKGRPGSPDWNQARGWASLRIGFGREPGNAGAPQ
jgi:hypothetical protein